MRDLHCKAFTLVEYHIVQGDLFEIVVDPVIEVIPETLGGAEISPVAGEVRGDAIDAAEGRFDGSLNVGHSNFDRRPGESVSYVFTGCICDEASGF